MFDFDFASDLSKGLLAVTGVLAAATTASYMIDNITYESRMIEKSSSDEEDFDDSNDVFDPLLSDETQK